MVFVFIQKHFKEVSALYWNIIFKLKQCYNDTKKATQRLCGFLLQWCRLIYINTALVVIYRVNCNRIDAAIAYIVCNSFE